MNEWRIHLRIFEVGKARHRAWQVCAETSAFSSSSSFVESYDAVKLVFRSISSLGVACIVFRLYLL